MRSPQLGSFVFAPVLLFVLAASPSAQEQAPESHGSAAPAPVRQEIRRWSAANGPGWHAFLDGESGWAELLAGGRRAPAFAPATQDDYLELARAFVEETAHLTGLETATLAGGELRLLPLAAIGSTDKISARFSQELDGLPVFGARVNVLLDLEGGVLSVQSTASPGLVGTPTDPLLGADAARAQAIAAFGTESGLPATQVGEPELGIAQYEAGGRSHAALAWRVEVQWRDAGAVPEAYEYRIDARRGALLDRRPLVHFLDVGGTVTSNVTPGVDPDTGSNPPLTVPLSYVQVTSPAGTVYTDGNGEFLFPGVNGPLDCTFEYVGTFADVDNETGPEHVLNQTLSGTGNVVLMNPSPTEFITSQSNAYNEIAVLRDWIRAVDPSDGTADFQAVANVNLDQNCNAYFDGGSVNFFTSGGSCVNTAYSSVVAHEMGHWLNALYDTGNGSDGMGEGNADVFAMYLYDHPEVGRGFFGPGTNVRTGWNSRPFCGDCFPGCAGQVHADGEVWMGAAWKIRDHLNNTHGDALGDAIADSLFSGWMNAYDQREIKSVIELQWLTLDDDNGNLDDGTPHYADIDQGFRDQQFPGFDLPDVLFTDVTELPDTSDVLGPYPVAATVTGVADPTITSVELFYRDNAGAWASLPMASLGGGSYAADLPGQPLGSVVEYFLSGTDGSGTTDTYPREGAERPLVFSVGVVVLFADDFESGGPGDWTHGTFGDTPNTIDDWQKIPPRCLAGDPTGAFSGSQAWGNDLGAVGWDGLYEGLQHVWLRSPYVDCTTAIGTRLRFRRWLNVEQGSKDQARIRVNGQLVWKNESTQDTTDAAWEQIDLDISGAADGSPSIQLEFSLETDDTGEFGGWSIDDVEIVHAVYDCPAPANYGQAKVTSEGGVPIIGTAGLPSAYLDNFRIRLIAGMPSQLAILFSGDAPDNTPFLGGFRLVQPPLVREATVALDLFGDAEVPIEVLPSMVGTIRFYQFWFRDPGQTDGTGAGLSDGLEVSYCE